MKTIANVLVVLGALAIFGCATNSQSNAARQLSVTERVKINAPASKVWATVNNFGDLGAWHPAVANTDLTYGKNNEVDTVRLLTLQDGGTIIETLTAYDNPGMSYSYVINQGVLPVSNYASTIQVLSKSDNSSEVVWKGNFYRKDLSANPAKDADDATATNTIHAVYKGGLDNLKKITE